MKYLFTVLGIVVTITLLTIYFVWPEPRQPQADVAVTVNGHDLAKKAITAAGEKRGYHNNDYNALLDSAITRELLIQEAQRQNIDKEESFRQSLKSFYEQSLIKTLTDRQYSQIQVAVEESEIDKYLSFFGKKVTFSRLPVTSGQPAVPDEAGAVQNEVLFDNLSESLQLLLAGLKPGEFAIQSDTGSDRYAIRLDTLETSQVGESVLPDREKIMEMLTEYKRQQQLADWLEQLREKASITIHNE